MTHEDLLRIQQQLRMMEQANTLMRIGNWVFDESTNSLKIDQIASEILDFTDQPADQQGNRHIDPKLLYDNLSDEDKPLFAKSFSQVSENVNFSIRVHYKHPKGIEKSIRITHVFNPDNTVQPRTLGYVYDRTELEMARTKLKETESLFESMFQALPDLFFKYDENLLIIDYRAQQNSNLYVPPEAFLNKKIREVLPLSVALQFETAAQDAKSTGKNVIIHLHAIDQSRHRVF